MATATDVRDIPIIDTDTHVVEPPDLWTSRVSAKWGDLVPHVAWDPVAEEEAWYSGTARLGAVAHVAAELRGEQHAVSPALQYLTEEPLAPAVVPVDICRVEESHAGLERGVDDDTRALEIDAIAEVVAAEPHDGDVRPIAPQSTCTHGRGW